MSSRLPGRRRRERPGSDTEGAQRDGLPGSPGPADGEPDETPPDLDARDADTAGNDGELNELEIVEAARRERLASRTIRQRIAAGGGLGSRVAVAVPGVVGLVALVVVGGPIFAVAVAVIAALALSEFYNLTAAWRPLRWAGFLAVLLAVAMTAGLGSPERGVLLGLLSGIGLVAVGGLILGRREDVTGRMAVTAFGLLYVGGPFAMLVATRALPDGAGAVANVFVGTWVFDTASFVGGKLWGRRRIAPRVSPGKTLEGLLVGVLVGTLAVAFAGLYMEWIDWWQSLIVGFVVCMAGFVGDLFESMLKRDVGAKDSGRLLRGHGGILDRFDALMFATVAAYAATVFLVY